MNELVEKVKSFNSELVMFGYIDGDIDVLENVITNYDQTILKCYNLAYNICQERDTMTYVLIFTHNGIEYAVLEKRLIQCLWFDMGISIDEYLKSKSYVITTLDSFLQNVSIDTLAEIYEKEYI